MDTEFLRKVLPLLSNTLHLETNEPQLNSYLWKSSIQWIWFEASTVKGMPSSDLLQTTQVKHCGW